MAGITITGVDTAAGAQMGGGQSEYIVNGSPVVVEGDPVAPHGDPPHKAATMTISSTWMTWNGIPVVRAGDLATCGHATTGQSNWDVE